MQVSPESGSGWPPGPRRRRGQYSAGPVLNRRAVLMAAGLRAQAHSGMPWSSCEVPLVLAHTPWALCHCSCPHEVLTSAGAFPLPRVQGRGCELGIRSSLAA